MYNCLLLIVNITSTIFYRMYIVAFDRETCRVTYMVSIEVSIVLFSNPWTVQHSFATVLIFGGAFAYSQVPDVKIKVGT